MPCWSKSRRQLISVAPGAAAAHNLSMNLTFNDYSDSWLITLSETMLQYHKYLIFNLNQNHQLIFWKTLRISGIPEKLEKCQERKKAVREEGPTNISGDRTSPRWLKYECPAVAANCRDTWMCVKTELDEGGRARGTSDMQHQHFLRIHEISSLNIMSGYHRCQVTSLKETSNSVTHTLTKTRSLLERRNPHYSMLL